MREGYVSVVGGGESEEGEYARKTATGTNMEKVCIVLKSEPDQTVRLRLISDVERVRGAEWGSGGVALGSEA